MNVSSTIQEERAVTSQPPRELASARTRKSRRTILLLGGLVITLCVLNAQSLLVFVANRFRVNDPVKSDAIVLLIGDRYNERARMAAELFRQGIAPHVWVGETEVTDRAVRKLMEFGVPSHAIHRMPMVDSTYREAIRARDMLGSYPDVRRITVVSTAFHTARARWVFQKILRPMGIEVHTCTATEPRFNEQNWYTRPLGISNYAKEFIKTIYYRIHY